MSTERPVAPLVAETCFMAIIMSSSCPRNGHEARNSPAGAPWPPDSPLGHDDDSRAGGRYDDTLPREAIHEQLRIRVDDMIRGQVPLSHMHPDKSVRDQTRPRIRDAVARGKAAMAGYDVRLSKL